MLVAPPDEHLTVVARDGKSYVRLLHGPRENHCRPAIDPLFRSAATAFLEETIGVLLSGYLDDGTVGLQAIKACGGLVIVQDPFEAKAMDMPASALQNVDVDRVLRVNDIASSLVEMATAIVRDGTRGRDNSLPAVPNWIEVENRITSTDSDMDDIEQIGKPSSLTCPECSGALWEVGHQAPIRYRCHTGHAFTAKVLETLQRDAVEDAIWGAVRALHEQERLFSKLSERERQSGKIERAAEYEAKATQVRGHSQTLREVVVTRTLMVKT